jgi:hypothetical protein
MASEKDLSTFPNMWMIDCFWLRCVGRLLQFMTGKVEKRRIVFIPTFEYMASETDLSTSPNMGMKDCSG